MTCHRAGGELSAIFVCLHGDDEHEPFASPDQLVRGLSFDEPRADIRAVLGTPVNEGAGFDVFAVGPRFVHVEYADDRPRMVTALLRQVQG